MAYLLRGGAGGGAGAIPVVHTADAATKLSDRVRRYCFNCCTTDTSTWRKSNLSPGKVLCNKCGLFERTHSRPRPKQFPPERGPFASPTLRSRSPPQQDLFSSGDGDFNFEDFGHWFNPDDVGLDLGKQ
ncbi:hypothetical protein K438DRAFT_1827499 [Mycena galopus ATCC 62051]|nr:hypothetical protein K438DRAFT_1827499 [Mycena galopus ATCC 62051]